MILAISDRADSYIQFMTILIIFVFVLFITRGVTKWIAGYQQGRSVNANIEIVETSRIANGKYIQIIKIGEKYLAVAVCKDSVTMLTEIPKGDLRLLEESKDAGSFKDILDKIKNKNSLEKEDGQNE